jgi:ribosomal protein S18 acetylase RimI-like enzyme
MIRRLQPSDAAAYRTVRLDALRLYPEVFGSSYEEEAQYPLEEFARFLSPPDTVLGAFDADRLVGITGLYVPRKLKQRHKGHIVGVYVDAAHRRAGLARRLVEAIIDDARRAQLRLVQLSVTVGNDTARRLYESLGFRRYGIERRALLINGVLRDEELMALDLDGPLASPAGVRRRTAPAGS